MANYIAVVHRDPKGDFGVSFPDFPGCITAGATIDEAKDRAHDALSLHIESLLDDGLDVAAPSKLEDIIDRPDYGDAVAVLVISVSEAKPKSIRVNITVPEDKLRKIDAVAKERGMSRSSFLVHAAEKFREVEYGQAVPILEAAHNQASSDTMVSMLLAEAYSFNRSPDEVRENRDAYDRALALFDDVLEHEPGNMLARLRRAALRAVMAPGEDALTEQRQLVEEARGSQFEAVAELELARRHLTCGQGDRALSLYGELQVKHPWMACVLHSETGVCHAMIGDHSSAIQSFRHAVEATTLEAMAALQKTSRELMGDAYWAYWSSVDNLSVRQCQNHAWLAGLFSLRDEMAIARQHLGKAIGFLHADEVGDAQATLKREFVNRMEQMFPKLANEKEVQELKKETEGNGK